MYDLFDWTSVQQETNDVQWAVSHLEDNMYSHCVREKFLSSILYDGCDGTICDYSLQAI